MMFARVYPSISTPLCSFNLIFIEGSSCYFTVVIAHNESTRSSAPIPYQANARGRITMDDFYCAIDNVEPGFEIYVEIYMLQVSL